MSTLESAICISLILVLLTFMITGPECIALDSFECAKDGGNELFYMEQDREGNRHYGATQNHRIHLIGTGCRHLPGVERVVYYQDADGR